MRIVLVGGGKVGELLCHELAESCEVVLIDTNPKIVEHLFSQYDIQAIVGNGADVKVQEEANVSEADMFLAMTGSDELNIIASIIAKRIGAKYTIARVRAPEYHASIDFIRSSLGITAMLNPDEESAAEINELLSFPTAKSIETFVDGKVRIVETTIEDGTLLHGMTLREFRESFDGRLLVCIIERNGEVIVPTGNSVLYEGDRVHVTGSGQDLRRFYRTIKKDHAPIKSTIIIGGGRIAYYLLQKLTKRRMDIKLIEVNEAKAMEMSQQFSNIVVINSDGTSQDVLDGEGLSSYDSCIALTGIDEENVIISIYAKSQNVHKCISKVSRTSILRVLSQIGMDTIITPKRIITDKILRMVRSIGNSGGSGVERLYTLADDTVEAIEFLASEHSKILGISLTDLELHEGTLIAFIYRSGQSIFPSGRDSIQAGDRVIVVTTRPNVHDLDDIAVR
ncbi:MAG: Trk system potassium transporter TrkA [Tissierellia bacterium]|nr:Trk system potassium transporter TrkA [Tissierellia bacterium]